MNYFKPARYTQNRSEPAGAEKKDNETVMVLLVDDHQLMRDWVRKTVEKMDGFEVAGEAANGKEAVQLARELSPDIIIMDISMPEINGIEATRLITAVRPNTRVIGLSTRDDDNTVTDMIDAGASAFVPKLEAYKLLAETIQKVAADLQQDLRKTG